MSYNNRPLTRQKILVDGIRRMHFIGILGAGMLPLAGLVRSLGYTVTGSDSKMSEAQMRSGFSVSPHAAENVRGAGLVVTSLAISGGNPEIKEAKRLQIPIITRAELLGVLMSGYRTRIGVSGSHGKSTTTALIDKILSDAGMEPTTVSGATLCDGCNVRIGKENLLVYEACEYKDAFLNFLPTIQVITSIELDHTDYFPDIGSLRESFKKAADPADTVILNADFDGADDFSASLSSRVVSYGASESADYRYCITEKTEGMTRFYITKYGELLLTASTSLLGEYNLANITAAVAVADLLGIGEDMISSSISSFFGIDRRMSLLCRRRDHDIYYDYAHHPSEITSAIDALKERYGKCTVVFCPHTFTRTESLWNDFVSALSKADFTILLDIYPAREKPIKGITSKNLARAIGDTCVYSRVSDVPDLIDRSAVGVVVVMGAGDVDALIRLLKDPLS